MTFTSSIAEFRGHLAQVCDLLAGRALNGDLADWLNNHHGAGSDFCRTAGRLPARRG